MKRLKEILNNQSEADFTVSFGRMHTGFCRQEFINIKMDHTHWIKPDTPPTSSISTILKVSMGSTPTQNNPGST
eukprot:9708972-Ditylum_brightwellii.AAC.1